MLDFFKQLVTSWPFVVLILGGILMFIVRKKLPGLFDRMTGLNVGQAGVAISAAAASTGQLETKAPESGLAPEIIRRLEELRNIPLTPMLQDQERIIRADVERLHLGQDELNNILIRHLAIVQLLYRAETVYRAIFGSQISILKAVNTLGAHTRLQLTEFYENAKAQFPQLYEIYSFEQYLHYLTSQQLIIEETPGLFAITVAGKEFLKWITEMGVTESKPF